MKLIDFIICDDIRSEVGNKHTLVGVFSDINVPYKKGAKKPVNIFIKLGIFIRCLVDDSMIKPDSFKLELTHNTKGQLQPFEGPLSIHGNVNYINLVLVTNYVIPDEGRISFKLFFSKSGKVIETMIPEYTFGINIVEQD